MCRLVDEVDRGNWPWRNSSWDWTDSYRLGMYGSILTHNKRTCMSISACKKDSNCWYISSAAWSECLQKLLQQPACSQSTAGPEKTGQARAGLPAALPGVALQQEVGPLELPGHPPFTSGEISTAAARDPQTHSSWSPRCSQSGESCRLSTLLTYFFNHRWRFCFTV